MSATDPLPDLRRPGWERRDDHGSGVHSLHYPDGTIAVEHVCTRPRDGRTVLHAPVLQLGAGHTVTQDVPLTVAPSVGCDDCGLHGFITGGGWRPV